VTKHHGLHYHFPCTFKPWACTRTQPILPCLTPPTPCGLGCTSSPSQQQHLLFHYNFFYTLLLMVPSTRLSPPTFHPNHSLMQRHTLRVGVPAHNARTRALRAADVRDMARITIFSFHASTGRLPRWRRARLPPAGITLGGVRHMEGRPHLPRFCVAQQLPCRQTVAPSLGRRAFLFCSWTSHRLCMKNSSPTHGRAWPLRKHPRAHICTPTGMHTAYRRAAVLVSTVIGAAHLTYGRGARREGEIAAGYI